MDGRILEAFEGFTMIFAVAVLTWMLFWMKRQSAGISRDLKHQVDRALSGGSVAARPTCVLVGRARGFETALFLFAGSTNQGRTSRSRSVASWACAGGWSGVVIYYGLRASRSSSSS
jgi:high-affinity iron transporter